MVQKTLFLLDFGKGKNLQSIGLGYFRVFERFWVRNFKGELCPWNFDPLNYVMSLNFSRIYCPELCWKKGHFG